MPGIKPAAIQVGQSVFGTVRYPAGGFHHQVQTRFQLFILHRGGVTVTWADKKVRLNADRAFMLVPGNTYAFQFSHTRESRHSWLTYADTDVTVDRRILFGLQTAAAPFSGRLQSLINVFLTYIRQPETDDRDILIPLAGLALTQFSREVSGRLAGPRNIHPAVERAARYMYDSMEQDIRLADIAGAVHVSPEHLVRLFKKAGYPPPVAYLWELRVGRALSLLKGTGLDFTAIGLQAGFKTPFHFSRKIKEATGLPPTAYRKKYGA